MTVLILLICVAAIGFFLIVAFLRIFLQVLEFIATLVLAIIFVFLRAATKEKRARTPQDRV